MVVARLRLEVARRRGSPVFLFVGKFSMMPARCVSLATAWVASRCESDLSIESCLVVVSTARGEDMSGRESQSGSSMVRQRGAIE
jgi:hypothetical protein